MFIFKNAKPNGFYARHAFCAIKNWFVINTKRCWYLYEVDERQMGLCRPVSLGIAFILFNTSKVNMRRWHQRQRKACQIYISFAMSSFFVAACCWLNGAMHMFPFELLTFTRLSYHFWWIFPYSRCYWCIHGGWSIAFGLMTWYFWRLKWKTQNERARVRHSVVSTVFTGCVYHWICICESHARPDQPPPKTVRIIVRTHNETACH